MIRVRYDQSFGGGGRPVDDAYFLFMFELPQGQNARGVMDRLREGVRAFFAGRDLDYGMGALGGDFRCYGHARRLRGPTTEDDRQALAGWVGRPVGVRDGSAGCARAAGRRGTGAAAAAHRVGVLAGRFRAGPRRQTRRWCGRRGMSYFG